jgi:tripartite-type tricarboxylate transporter receptor subunit TctC
MHRLKNLSAWLILGVMTIMTPALTTAQEPYPQRPIKLIVPYPPGGTTDVIARNVAQTLSERLGVSVVVDNKAGAAGMIGMAAVAKAAPDGYTLLVSDASIATTPSLNKTMSFDPLKDLTAVAWFVTLPHVIVVNPKNGIESLNDLIILAKKDSEKLYFSSGGMGSPLHLAGEAVRTSASINWVHVPYKGGGPAILAVMSGDAQVAVPSLPSVQPQLEAGKLKALAVTSPKRVKTLPMVASVTELGFPDAVALGWIGLHAPTGTPTEIIRKLETISAQILKEPPLRNRMTEQGAELVEDPSARAYTEFVSAQTLSWEKIVKAAQIEVQ